MNQETMKEFKTELLFEMQCQNNCPVNSCTCETPDYSDKILELIKYAESLEYQVNAFRVAAFKRAAGIQD